MSPRYAVYYTAAADAPLTLAAAAFLGRDAFGRALEPVQALPGLEHLDLQTLTADPRGYGFHATLKAPFEMAPGRSEAELVAALEAYCRTAVAFDAPIAVADIGPFIAFRLTAASPQMQTLHEDSVRKFEAFRAPLSDFDLARRRKAPLTPVQDERLVAFGYPYIFEDFRFHMTLTGAVKDPAERAAIVAALRERFAPHEGLHRFETLAIFKQPSREAPFDVLAISKFAG